MDVSTLINGGWNGFIAVIVAAAALIASFWIGRSDDETVSEGGKVYHYAFGRATLTFIAIIWAISRGMIVPAKWLSITPVALVVPAVDAALFAATLALLCRGLAGCFGPVWTWRRSVRQWRFFLLPLIMGYLFFEDLKAYPAEWWYVAGVEAALLLPFLLRLGYDDRQTTVN